MEFEVRMQTTNYAVTIEMRINIQTKKWLNRQLYILLQSKSPNYSIYCLNNDGVMFEMRCVCFFLRELE